MSESLLTNYQDKIASLSKEIDELPNKVIPLEKMKRNLEEMRQRYAQAQNRLKETTFFSENSPGIVQVFQRISPDDVDFRSRIFKGVVLGATGAAVGGGLAALLTLACEFFRRNLRTRFQAAIATGSVPVLCYNSNGKDSSSELRSFWIRSIARHAPGKRRFLLATVGRVSAEGEFWNGLFEVIGAEDHRILFMDCGRTPIEAGFNGQPLAPYDPNSPAFVSSLSPASYSRAGFKQLLTTLPERHILLVRWDTSNSPTLIEFKELFDRYYFLSSLNDARLDVVENESQNYRDILGDAHGTVLIDRKKLRPGHRLMGVFEDWLIDFRKKRRQTKPEHAL